jgi:hypothetical protein
MPRDSCTKLLEMMDILLQFLPNLIISDEVHFHVSGYVNKQNFRYWAEENNRIKLLMEYERVTQKVRFDNAVSPP